MSRRYSCDGRPLGDLGRDQFANRTRFECGNDQIRHLSVGGIRPGIEVGTLTDRRRFVGDVIPALYAALRHNEAVTAGEVDADSAYSSVWPASLCRGPIMHPGAVVHSSTRLAFIATGLLDSLVGVPGVTEFPVSAITSIALRGQLDPRLEIQAGKAHMTISCEQPRDHHADLVAWLSDQASGPVWLGGGPPSAPIAQAIETVLLPWRATHRFSKEIRIFTAAVHVSATAVATPGWLLVGDDTMVWLPGRVPENGARPVQLALAGRSWFWNDDPDEIHADLDGMPQRWLTKTRRPFRVALFKEVERARKQQAEASEEAAAGNRRDSYRVEVIERRSLPVSFLVAVDGAFRPLVCRTLDLSLGGCGIRSAAEIPVGTVLRVELAEKGMVHTADSKVVGSRPTKPGDGWIAGVLFEKPSPDFEAALRTLWMLLQREQLQRLTGGRDVAG